MNKQTQTHNSIIHLILLTQLKLVRMKGTVGKGLSAGVAVCVSLGKVLNYILGQFPFTVPC